MAVRDLDDATYDDFRSQPGTALIDFTAAWCPPCRRMDPLVEELARELPGVRVGRVDVDRNPATAAREGVQGMPTFLVYRDGRKVGHVVGAVPKARLAAAVQA